VTFSDGFLHQSFVRLFLRVRISVPFADENIFDHITGNENFWRLVVVVDGRDPTFLLFFWCVVRNRTIWIDRGVYQAPPP